MSNNLPGNPPLTTEIPLIQKLCDFYKVFHPYTAKFPKADRYTLGQTIENSLFELIEITLSCSSANPLLRREKLQAASVKLDLTKLLLRLSYEVKAVDQKTYISLQKRLQEIGKMIGGWLRSTV